MSSLRMVEILQYGCACGKEFSGDPKRVELLLRLHYKKCKCPKSKETTSEKILIQNSRRNRNGSSVKTIAGLGEEIQINSDGLSAIKSLFFSS